MGTEPGKQMGLAIQAVLQMEADCARLFRDLDKALNELRPISNTVTAGAGYTIDAPQLYLPKLLFRRYAASSAEHLVLALNVCLHNHPAPAFIEPILIVGNVEYTPETSDRDESWRPWDPWSAFFDWSSEMPYGRPLAVTPKRSTVTKIVVAAEPLYSITSLEAALRVIDMVGRPGKSATFTSLSAVS
jgi:hypothetical protein